MVGPNNKVSGKFGCFGKNKLKSQPAWKKRAYWARKRKEEEAQKNETLYNELLSDREEEEEEEGGGGEGEEGKSRQDSDTEGENRVTEIIRGLVRVPFVACHMGLGYIDR